jgi:lysophospholipase
MSLVSDPLVDSLVGLTCFSVKGPHDKAMRAAFVPAVLDLEADQSARGSIIFSPGRTEFIEKHANTVADLVARGYNVLIIDQRGQGLSDRLTANPVAGHMDSFQDAARHLAAAIDAAGPRLVGPHILMCHSMGGCVGLEGLLMGALPSITGAIFVSPMWGIAAPKLVRHLAKFLCRIGQGQAIAPSTPRIWKPDPFDGNPLTHDRQHFARANALFLAEPGLQLAGPTNGWLNCAYDTMDSFTPARLAQLTLPVLVVNAEKEALVDNSAHARVVSQLPHAKLETITGAKHELLHERPDLRAQCLTHIDNWLMALTPMHT